MRKNAYGIFRALRHFGVTANEVDAISEFYKTWLAFPIEEKSVYNWVYYLNGRMISMPFEIKDLNDNLIGYSVKNKVFSVCKGEKIAKENIEDCVQLFKQELDKRMLGADGNADLQVHIPSKDEAEFFFKTFANHWMTKCVALAEDILGQLSEEMQICFPFYNQINNMWITPDADEPEKTAVKLGIKNYSGPYCKKYTPTERTKSNVCLIMDLRQGVDFIGKLSRYGTPTPATVRMYYELIAGKC